jgi:hypothetical protein
MRQIATAATLVTLLSSALIGQDANRPNTRDGLWFGVGLGVGSIGADCAACSTDRTAGGSGNLRMGGTLTPSVLLGGEMSVWTHSSGSSRETMGFVSGIIIWYPSPVGAFFLKGGVGAMNYSDDDGANRITATAPSVSLGMGYDIRISGDVSVTPFMNGLTSADATYRFNNSSTGFNSNIKLNLFQFGLGLTWH